MLFTMQTQTPKKYIIFPIKGKTKLSKAGLVIVTHYNLNILIFFLFFWSKLCEVKHLRSELKPFRDTLAELILVNKY